MCVQTSRELKVCGAIGPCVSLNSKGSCVSENVSPCLQILIPPFSFSQLYSNLRAAIHHNVFSVVV